MSDDTRAEFEAWFHAAYGPPPADEWLLANLAEAARLEAFMGGAWAAWQYLSSVADTRDEQREADARAEVVHAVAWSGTP